MKRASNDSHQKVGKDFPSHTFRLLFKKELLSSEEPLGYKPTSSGEERSHLKEEKDGFVKKISSSCWDYFLFHPVIHSLVGQVVEKFNRVSSSH